MGCKFSDFSLFQNFLTRLKIIFESLDHISHDLIIESDF